MLNLDGLDSRTLAALLDWQRAMGADEAIGDAPVDRFAEAEAASRRAAAQPPAVLPAAASVAGKPARAAWTPPPEPAKVDPAAVAEALAGPAATLDDLAAVLQEFEHCELKKGARNFVFCDGRPGARVMVVGEAPGRDEDIQGKPFVGAAGRLLDRMFAAIGLSRGAPDAEAALYICNVLPWRPPQNRTPEPDEIAMMRPFLQAHVRLADPDVLVLMGNTPCQAVLGRAGILKLRGQWAEAWGKPVLPMTHPAYLLRTPEAKREAWADLLSLRAKLREMA